MRHAVLIFGCGEIGTALISGWLNKKKIFKEKISKIFVLEKSSKQKLYLKKKFGKEIAFVEKKENINRFNKIKYIFLTVKPKDLNSLFNYNFLVNRNSIIFSVLAGKHVKDIEVLIRLASNNQNQKKVK